MKIIDLTAPAQFNLNDCHLASYYMDEVRWLREVASRYTNGKNSVVSGSYHILVHESKLFSLPEKVSQIHPEVSFVINEYIRLKQEAVDIDALIALAMSVAALRRDLSFQDLLGLKSPNYDDPSLKISTDSTLMIKNFQRANNSLLIKMKEISVRALLRGIQPPFVFDENFDVGNDKSVLTSHHNTQAHKRGTYKSLFDK